MQTNKYQQIVLLFIYNMKTFCLFIIQGNKTSENKIKILLSKQAAEKNNWFQVLLIQSSSKA